MSEAANREVSFDKVFLLFIKWSVSKLDTIAIKAVLCGMLGSIIGLVISGLNGSLVGLGAGVIYGVITGYLSKKQIYFFKRKPANKVTPSTALYGINENYLAPTHITASLLSDTYLSREKEAVKREPIYRSYFRPEVRQVQEHKLDYDNNAYRDYIDSNGRVLRLTVKQLKEMGVIK